MENFLRCFPILLIGVMLFLTPNLTRRGLLFAVPVPPDFHQSEPARRAITLFRRNIAVALAFTTLFALLWRSGPWVDLIPPVLLLAAGTLAFYRANRLVVPFRAEPTKERSMDLTAEQERSPRAFWFATGPFLFLAFVALFMHFNWDAIPEKFPVHWGGDGSADRWASKGVLGVYGPIIFATESCAFCLLMAYAFWFGSRRSAMRSGILNMMISVEYILALAVGGTPLKTLLPIPFWVGLAAVLVPLPLLIAYMIKKASEPSDPPEPTPDECWKAGLVYYNPNDSVLVVEKRTGFGYTLNFANPWSWALGAMALFIAVSAPFILA